MLLGGFDVFGHDPVVFGDLSEFGEAAIFEHCDEAKVDKAPIDGSAVEFFRIGFNQAPALFGDDGEGFIEGQRRDAFLSIFAVDKEAGDPPIGLVFLFLFVKSLEFVSGREFRCGAELAPSDAEVSIEDEGSVGFVLADFSVFTLFAGLEIQGFEIQVGMEPEAPAPAPDSVVAFDEVGVSGPGFGVERVGGEAGHGSLEVLEVVGFVRSEFVGELIEGCEFAVKLPFPGSTKVGRLDNFEPLFAVSDKRLVVSMPGHILVEVVGKESPGVKKLDVFGLAGVDMFEDLEPSLLGSSEMGEGAVAGCLAPFGGWFWCGFGPRLNDFEV